MCDNSKKIYYKKLDGIRAYACLCIVFMHVLVNGDFGLSGFLFERFIPFFSSFVALFMILSSFSMCCGYYEKVVTGNFDLEKFYIRRYQRIFPFFALLCTIELIYHHDISSLFDWIADLTLAFGFIPNNHIEIIGVGWFIGVVFIFYMLFPFFCFLIKNKKRAWGTMFVALILNLLCLIHFHDAIGRSVFIYSFMYFAAGGMIFIYRDILSYQRLFIPAVIIFFFVVFINFTYLPYEYTLLVLFILVTVIGISSGGGGISSFLFCSKFIKYIGTISLEVYLCHMIIFRIIQKLNLLHMVECNIANYILVCLMTTIGACLFAVLSKKVLSFFKL